MTSEADETYLVTEAFPTVRAAERALRSLEREGVTEEDVSLVVAGEAREEVLLGRDNHGLEGAATGGLLGAIAAGMVTLALAPPIAMVGIAGPLLAAMGGAVVGGAGGTLLGAFLGAEIPRDHAHRLVRSVERGEVVMAIGAPSSERAERIASICELEGSTRIGFDHAQPEALPDDAVQPPRASATT
jgi:hypothetical protein